MLLPIRYSIRHANDSDALHLESKILNNEIEF